MPNHPMNLDDIQTEYPMVWVESKLLFNKTKLGYFIGICRRTKRACRVDNGLIASIVDDIRVYHRPKDWCDNRRNCLYSNCPLNETRQKKTEKRLSEVLNQVDAVSYYEQLLEKHPDHCLILDSSDVAEGNDNVKRSNPLKMRFHIFKRDNYHCVVCGRGAEDGVKLELGHKIAKANGGTFEETNLVTLCFDCNRGQYTDEL